MNAELKFKTINSRYYDTKHVVLWKLILELLFIRVSFFIQKICFTVKPPVYEVNIHGAVLQLDHKNKRFRRIYPDVTEYREDISTKLRCESYSSSYFYDANKAIYFLEKQKCKK